MIRQLPVKIPILNKGKDIVNVAVYTRVSTRKNDQKNSFEMQAAHYIQLVNNQVNWNLVDIYADYGISGTSINKRTDFNRMLYDCEAGLIDLILVKSVSRFARNTLECIQTTRRLKELEIAVYFEKERINSLTAESELMLSLVSSFAQEESISISSNIRWGIKQMMKEGTYIPSKVAYGYRRENENLVIAEEEAKVVRRIFQRYADGLGYIKIAHELNELKVPTITGCEKWSGTSVGDIIRNDVYAGVLVSQRYYMTDTFPPIEKRNYGEKSKYVVYDNHPAIIDEKLSEKVRSIRELKREKARVPDVENWGKHCFVRKLYCGYTQKPYRRSRNQFFVNESDDNNQVTTYRSIEVSTVENGFIRVVEKLSLNIEILDEIIAEYRRLSKRKVNPVELKDIQNQIAYIKKQMHDLVVEQTLDPKPSAFYMQQRDELIVKQTRLLKDKRKISSFQDYETEIDNIQRIKNQIMSEHQPSDFNEVLFKSLVKKIEIYDESIVIVLLDCLRFCERRGDLL